MKTKEQALKDVVAVINEQRKLIGNHDEFMLFVDLVRAECAQAIEDEEHFFMGGGMS